MPVSPANHLQPYSVSDAAEAQDITGPIWYLYMPMHAQTKVWES